MRDDERGGHDFEAEDAVEGRFADLGSNEGGVVACLVQQSAVNPAEDSREVSAGAAAGIEDSDAGLAAGARVQWKHQMTGFRRSQSNMNWLLFAAILAVVALLAAAPMSAQSVASLPAKPSDYVSDFAHVLSPATVAELDNICSQLDHTKANAQFAIVTVNTLAGDYPEDYADQLETKWKMGKKGSDRGLLFLLAVQDHKYRIEPGYGLEGVLNDAKVGDIGRSMVPDLKAGDYNNAVMLAVGQLAQDVAADAGVSLSLNGADRSAPASRAAAPQPRNSGLGNLILFLIVIILFGGFSIVRILLGAGLFFGGWGGRWGGPWIGGGMGGGGWGSGGGGGGFGGFGGGSFGGGGAGGSW